MQLDEARSRKLEIIRSRAEGLSASAAEPGSGGSGVYVGIVPSRDPDGYRVAVRLTGDDEVEPTARIDALREIAGPDADIRFVGRVRALSVEPPTNPQPEPTAAPEPPEEPSGPADDPTTDQLQQRIRPLVRGSSVAHVDVTAGTLGAFVTLDGATEPHVLSNNHVLAASGEGKPGDEVRQPGPYDGGGQDDRFGELAAAVELDPEEPNLVDAAVAKVDAGVEVDPAAWDGAVTEVVDAADVEGRVRKIGRTTGVTRGRISAIEVDGLPVGYDTGTFVFDDQIEIEGVSGAFSAGGDSGSVITTEDDRRGVGLLFAGSTTGGPSGTGVTYANPLQAVLDALGATLLGAPALASDTGH